MTGPSRETSQPRSRPASAPRATSTARAGAECAEGDYGAKGWYGGLPSSIDVTLTIADGTVSAVTVVPNATDPTSLDYQRRFAKEVPQVVVGRPIDGLRVDKRRRIERHPGWVQRRARSDPDVGLEALTAA